MDCWLTISHEHPTQLFAAACAQQSYAACCALLCQWACGPDFHLSCLLADLHTASCRSHARFRLFLHPAFAVGKAKGAHLRVHFKNVVEVAAAVKGMSVERAKRYLNAVMEHKEAIPIKSSKGGRGRHAQAKAFRTPGSLCFWPKNASKVVLGLLTNAAANAEANGLSTADLKVVHAQANQAPKGRRRTYRAHGRIGPYMSVPAHVELIVAPGKGDAVEKPAEEKTAPRLFRKKLAAKFRVPVGGA